MNRCFRNFGRRVKKRIATLVPDPLIDRYWPMVVERAAACRSPGLLSCANARTN